MTSSSGGHNGLHLRDPENPPSALAPAADTATPPLPPPPPEASPSQQQPHPPPPSTPPPNNAVITNSNPASSSAMAGPGGESEASPSEAQPVTSLPIDSTDHPMTDAPAAAITTSEAPEPQQQATPVQNSLQREMNMEYFTPSTPYNPAPMAGLDQQQAYMMMALASMSAGPPAMSPPSIVTPSQVTLPNPLDDTFGFAANNSLRPNDASKALESFARIEFADSVFQMTTYAVIIGRDQRALDQARRDEKRQEEYTRRVDENARKGLPPPSPMAHDRTRFSKSYVSEEGGMLGPESDSEGNGRPAKRRKTSTAGSSQQENDESQQNMISNRQYVSHTPGAAAVDLTSLRPSPWHVAFLGIHSPGPNIASKTKAISREHMKIEFNQKTGVFEAIVIHKNGFFCEDVHYKDGRVVLRCGDRLQVKDIDFRFLINGVERGCTGAEEEEALRKRSLGGKEMSFDFESSHANGEVRDTSDELSELQSPPELSDLGEEEDGEDSELVDQAEQEPEPEPEPEEPAAEAVSSVPQEALHDPQLDQQLIPQIPKKRGPGRPPKNGIMSKREQRLLKKQQQEMAKKTLPQAPPVEPPIKRKVGRPRKHPLPENSSDRPEKRKYKPRKPKEDGAEGSDAERRAREKKEKKTRPKSPPLELNIEDYTEEQLQKPNKNYGVLIDETLTAAGPDGLTLKQIYKRISQRYPWFYFHTETKGWESSVRHNLIGNEAFRKDETTNMWSRVPGVELDAGKKRKASSPDRGLAAQGYGPYSYPYNTAQHMAPGAPGYPPGQAPPGYQVPAYNPQQAQAPRPMQPYGASQSPPVPPAQGVVAQPPAPAQIPGYPPPPAPARPPLGGPQPGTYSSPYASRPPPPPANPQIKNEDGHPPSAVAPVVQPPPRPIASGATPAMPRPVPVSQRPVAPSNSLVAATPASAPAAPTASAPARPVIDPRLLAAVNGLKNGLVTNLKKARNPQAEAIVMSALNRCIGLKKEATENDKMESICMKGIRQVIDGFCKTKSPTPGGTLPADATPPVLEAKVIACLNGFKDVSIKALAVKLGEAKAEAVTLSAIDRVLGLADASIVAPPAEGESSPGNFEGVEQHLIKSIRQLLIGMNQTVREMPK